METTVDINRVHPELRKGLSMMPAGVFTKEGLPTMRKAMGQMMIQAAAPDPSVNVYNKTVPGPEGSPDVRIRIYEPVVKSGKRPGILYIHGGGYIVGSPEMTDFTCIHMVQEIGCVVVSVDYRLSPETTYPGPLEDCYAALRWFASSAEETGVDADRIAVAGGSAGGGLAAALALLARDRKGPAIAFQAPLYPMLDDRNITPSSYEFTDKRFWNRTKNEFGWEMYLGELYKGDVPEYAAPARAADLSGLPPTFTLVGELDLFRDETIEYCSRLLRAGVPVELHIYPGCYHGFDMNLNNEIGRRAENEIIQALKRALTG
ncbi:MAG: alpha/beta hydrolase [Clostridiales bacterium]|nr:alpha/beta hydrolase [Clostridiales bacterium]